MASSSGSPNVNSGGGGPGSSGTTTTGTTQSATSSGGGGGDHHQHRGSPSLNHLLGGTQRKGGGGLREYCLRWNNHQPNLVSFFTELWNNESFVDVTLVSSEGKQIPAHKLVLSACSPYFQEVFENNPCKHPIVILKDVSYIDLRTIIKFMYNGEVNISQDRINNILSTASTLKVKGLAEVPADELRRVGGSNSTNTRQNLSGLQSSSSWDSREGERDLVSGELPRKKLKKSSTATGATGTSTNGEQSSVGSFESGVGASVSRSIDDAALGSETGNTNSPSTRPGPPPLTAATQPKSRSLDTGLESGVHGDSELSSGGFSENQNYDESSLGAERGYDLEVSDLKIDPVSDDGELEFDEDDNVYGADDNPDYGDSSSNSYLNMSASSSASYFNQPSNLHFNSSTIRRRVRYPKFPGTPSDTSVITNSKYETAISDLLTNPSLTFREAALRHGLNASSVWYHYRMKHGYRRKVDPYE